MSSFAPGTQVKVYLVPANSPSGWQPSGAALSEPTVAADGTLTIEGLEEGKTYVATAVVGGSTRTVRFTPTPVAAGGGEKEPTFEAVVFGANVESFGGEYSPFGASVTGSGLVVISGLLKLSGAIAGHGTLFTLPAACRPKFSKVVDCRNAEAEEQFPFAVKIKNTGVAEVLREMGAAVVPIFDDTTFPKNH